MSATVAVVALWSVSCSVCGSLGRYSDEKGALRSRAEHEREHKDGEWPES